MICRMRQKVVLMGHTALDGADPVPGSRHERRATITDTFAFTRAASSVTKSRRPKRSVTIGGFSLRRLDATPDPAQSAELPTAE